MFGPKKNALTKINDDKQTVGVVPNYYPCVALRGGYAAITVDYKSLAIVEFRMKKQEEDHRNMVSKDVFIGVLREVGSLH